MYLLDTNIISFIPRIGQNSENIRNNLSIKMGMFTKIDLFVSVISYQEIMFGIEEGKRKNGKEYKKDYFEALNKFVKNNLIVLDYTVEMASMFSTIQSRLLKDGKVVSDYDMMIAVTSLETGFALVTNNTKDFVNIPNLEFEDWTRQQKTT